ncbi:MAG: class I SAM-dependent methyltransferase [Candidatus Hydrogenedentota bacterium]|nr:MAG: class I SAM-dependent methyltransferase [Candidatus Hydrogenedentota bacterium]
MVQGEAIMDTERIEKKYRRNVHFYDWSVRPIQGLRKKAVARLGLQPGESVLDFGCGTGLSFGLLYQAVGPSGQIIGLDLSPEMLARARQRTISQRWENVRLIEADAEGLDLSEERVDAVLCFYTHDIMNSRQAVEKALDALRIGGRFVAAGAKQPAGAFGRLLGLITLLYSIPFIINLSGLACPWARLQELLGELEVEDYMWGSSYSAYGIKKGTDQ